MGIQTVKLTLIHEDNDEEYHAGPAQRGKPMNRRILQYDCTIRPTSAQHQPGLRVKRVTDALTDVAYGPEDLPPLRPLIDEMALAHDWWVTYGSQICEDSRTINTGEDYEEDPE